MVCQSTDVVSLTSVVQLLGRYLSHSVFVGVFVIFSCLCVHAYVHGFLNPINLGKFYWTAPLMCYVIGLSSKVGAVLKSRISTKEKGQAKRPTIQDQNTGSIAAICYEISITQYPLHSIRHRISVSSQKIVIYSLPNKQEKWFHTRMYTWK